MFRMPLSIALWSVAMLVLESKLQLIWEKGQWRAYAVNIFATILIVSVSFNMFRLVKVFSVVIRARLNANNTDNLYQRMVLTQFQFIEKIVVIVLGMVTIGLVFLRFETLARFGGGVLASAGLASVVIGFAAQESVSNLIAGFQIAFTQPIRIDDVVIIKGEYGTIEEIHLTYVVVKLWDKRRLITPIKYFTTGTFENWTRSSAEILGTMFFYVDYSAPVDKIREAFNSIVDSSKLWDKKEKSLVVIDAIERTIKLRALVSAANSGASFDLQCEVREKLIQFIQDSYPWALPQTRVDFIDDDVRLVKKPNDSATNERKELNY